MKYTLPVIRKILNLSQAEFAKKIGVSTVSISLWENEKREPSFSKLKKISELSNISIDDMVFSKKGEKND